MINTDVILERLSGLHPKIIDLSLGRTQRLLAQLGHPEQKLPPTLHVAGTNGKGSVIAYLRAINEAAGKKVHVYTSPHLVRFHERIRLAGRLIEEAYLQELLEECEKANAYRPITFFEITTAAAFLAFSRQPADLLLLETGLGGRLDATNVIERPLASIITPISVDHQQYLGNDVLSIASEKAGIVKPESAVIIGAQWPPVMEVLEAKTRDKTASIFRYGKEYRVKTKGEDLIYEDGEGNITLPLPNLPGDHQAGNAAIAIAATRFLHLAEKTHLEYGITHAEWPARLQRLKKGELVENLPLDSELWLDGGHNEAAGEVLVRYFRKLPAKELHLIFGMITTKDPAAFLRHFDGAIKSIHCLTIPGKHQSFEGLSLCASAKSLGLNAQESKTPLQAVRAIQASSKEPKRILICGSLYLAGAILADHE